MPNFVERYCKAENQLMLYLQEMTRTQNLPKKFQQLQAAKNS